jgi:trimeric autotransporter adhesin
MVAIDLGAWAGNAIYQFDLTNGTAAMVGAATGPYTGSCLAFLSPSEMLAFDTDTSGATFDQYPVTSSGFTYYNYSQYTEATLNGFGCFKLSGGIATANAGGVANPATVPATQIGIYPVNGGGEFSTSLAFMPDPSLQSAFYLTQSGSNGAVDTVESFNQNTFLPTGSLFLDMENIEGNVSYGGVDMVRWGQDGLAILTSGGHLYLLRGGFVVPKLLGTHSPATLASSSVTTIAHGSSNQLITLTGSNFVPGVAVAWNGSYRTTTIVSPTQLTVAIPWSDLSSTGSGTLIATNPGATGSNSLTITIN